MPDITVGELARLYDAIDGMMQITRLVKADVREQAANFDLIEQHGQNAYAALGDVLRRAGVEVEE